MKILRLFHRVGPTSAPYNQFSLGMKKHVEQTIVTFYSGEMEVDPAFNYYSGHGSVSKVLKILKDQIRTGDFDVIHVHSGHMGALLIAAALPLRPQILTRMVFTLHTSFHLLKTRNRGLVTSVALLSGATCACSQSSYESIPLWLRKALGRRLHCCVNGFDGARLERIQAEENIGSLFTTQDGLKMVSVGNLGGGKNQLAILKAIELAPDLNGELVFLGDGPNREALERYSAQIESGVKIRFMGKVPRDDVLRYLIQADSLVSLSLGEGMPISVLESLAAGCLAALSDIPPHREIRASEEGARIVCPNDPQQLAKVLCEFAEMSSGLREKLREELSQYVLDNYSLDSMLSKYLGLYALRAKLH
jgi:glycosyltransferase involved in cell wall biosynthesis